MIQRQQELLEISRRYAALPADKRQILKNRLKLFHGNDKPIGMDFKDPPIDTTTLAKGFGVTAERVDTATAFDSALARKILQHVSP